MLELAQGLAQACGQQDGQGITCKCQMVQRTIRRLGNRSPAMISVISFLIAPILSSILPSSARVDAGAIVFVKKPAT